MNKKNKQSLIWQIQQAGKSASFVIGTMHVKDKRAFQQLGTMQAKIDATQLFATEIELSTQFSNELAAATRLPDGVTLSKLMPPKRLEKMRRMLQKVFKIDLSHYEQTLPIVLSNAVSVHALQSENLQSLDETLWHYAQTQGKQLTGVETLLEQMQVLQKIDLRYQLKNLWNTCKHASRQRKETAQAMRYYQASDIDNLYKLSKKSLKGLRKLLLYDRNVVMAHRIAAMSSEQTACFAIGAGHLAGKKGVLRLLKMKGFAVTPCSYD